MTPRWFWPLTIMTFILGAVTAAALKTQNVVRRENLPSASYSGLAEYYMFSSQEIKQLHQTIGQLQQNNEVLTQNIATHEPDMRTLADQLNQARFLAGLTPVKGEGVIVTLDDSSKRPPTNIPPQMAEDLMATFIIHDIDIQRVVNELRASGAEAFAVNDQRVVATTAIRCVGPAIQVNGVPLTPPYVIQAIGDPDTLGTALALPGGIAEQLSETDPAMISITKSDSLKLPAYNGETQFRFSTPVDDSSGSQEAVQ